MQLEIEYRERLKMVNDEIKKRLVSKKKASLLFWGVGYILCI